LRAILWAALLPGLFAGYLPWRYFGVGAARPELTNPVHLLALGAIVAGTVLLGACIWQVGHTGRGTLSPLDPPTTLVVRGLYRYVRNPMYLSVTAIVLGEVLLTGSTTLWLYWLIWFVAVNVFVRAYEEPTLRRRFGSSYLEYTRRVGRWLPRVRPRGGGADRAQAA
jgi:protein-S-isoprenylcysteine O-methyltransferase Ste14